MWVILVSLSTLELGVEIRKLVKGVPSFFLRLETSLMTVPCSVRSSLMISFWIFVGRCFTANFMKREAFVV